MAYTKADKERASIVPEIVSPKTDIKSRLAELRPIDNLEFDNFAKHLAIARKNPQEYSGIITGFFKRWKLERETKAVSLLDDYLQKIRVASDSAAQLQETIIKNRIIFIFQVEFAQARLQEQWANEKKGYEQQRVSADLQIAKDKAFTRFYKTVDLSNLSEAALVLLNMTHPRSQSSSFATMGTQSSSSVQYGSPEEIINIKRQEKILEAVMGEYLENINLKKEQVKEAQVKTEHLKRKNEREYKNKDVSS